MSNQLNYNENNKKYKIKNNDKNNLKISKQS